MWIEYRYEDGSAWHGHPDDQTHELRIWAHEKEGFSWRVLTADVDANTPEGWSATLDDAKRHAETAYMEWYGYSCVVGELEVSLQALKEENAMLRDAVREERAAVVAHLRDLGSGAWLTDGGLSLVCLDEIADKFERGLHRREGEP